ncbi:MAG: M48 family metallopeptidase [Methylococcales symbiont of Hymedesmia sp. n. MRB-2018]|nr:MAG: M48 family metallopeptidase [Methylococcales symbiont of Hymedesmia sp. n. MRB-2018]KAF3984293.1 MAG: M48 family metallopeptidase [Methylococcales symbiont of Hymedesmia sp. n. MRB-2018]
MNPIITITRKDIKNINLRVKPTGEVMMSVPTKTTDSHIQYVLKKRSDWIKAKLSFYTQMPKKIEKEYVSGENCRFLGRNYRLKVIQSSDESVKLKGGYLYLSLKDTGDFKNKERLLKEWYLQKAKNHINKALAKYQPIVKREVKSVRIRKMQTRWGSCNPAKSYINLNSELIKAPTKCIEYVVLHELAHLIYPNHSKNFYNYLSVHIPNWQKIKNILESNKEQ